MRRREFAKTALLGIGGTALLAPPAAGSLPAEVLGNHQPTAQVAQNDGLSVRVGKTVEIT